MSALWVSHVSVHDAAAYARYGQAAVPVIAAHGGVFVVRGGAAEVLEGADHARHVVIRFPSLAAARACYDDPAYQAALAHAEGVSDRNLVIMEEISPE